MTVRWCDCYSVCMRAAGCSDYATESECRSAAGKDMLIDIEVAKARAETEAQLARHDLFETET